MSGGRPGAPGADEGGDFGAARPGRVPELLTRRPDADEDDGGTGLLEAPAKPRVKKPPLYKVVMLNDDYTPMEFVVEVLQMFFGMNREMATQIMLAVHTTGKATCGIYSRDIAETKSAQVNRYAQENEHPLVSEVEAVDDDDDEEG